MDWELERVVNKVHLTWHTTSLLLLLMLKKLMKRGFLCGCGRIVFLLFVIVCLLAVRVYMCVYIWWN